VAVQRGPVVAGECGRPGVQVRRGNGHGGAIRRILRHVHVVDCFPTTVTGKIRKVEMRGKAVYLLDLGAATAIRNA